MNWKIDGLKKDAQGITSDWNFVNQSLIDGVKSKEIKNVIKNDGLLTEVWREDWNLDEGVVGQVFQVTLNPGQVSHWHIHEKTIDRIFVSRGTVKLVLYDSRDDSPTYKRINEFKIGEHRPMLVVVPPKVFHAVQNISPRRSSLLTVVDKPYSYEDPDHWRLPPNSEAIPYKF